MEFQELKAKSRTTTGNGPARVLRRAGRVPAVLYGPGIEPMLLSVDEAELALILKRSAGGQVLFNLDIDGTGDAPRPAMLKEMQAHPLSQRPLHLDFYQISMDRKIRVRVPVTTTGKSKGVEFGGMLQIIRRELEVLCLPSLIPEAIEIDITEMDVGDSCHVEDLPLAEGVEIPADVNFTVLTILTPTKKEEDEVEEGEEEMDLEEEGAEATAEEAS